MALSQKEKTALNCFVHPPSETAASFARFAAETHENPGVSFGCVLDRAIIPLRPGRVMGVIARPGHGKTSFGAALIAQEARRIIQAGQQDSLYACHVTWEQPVEEVEALYLPGVGATYSSTDVAWGRIDPARVKLDAAKRPRLPVWIFGDSLYATGFNTPPMTIESVRDSIEAVSKDYNKTPSIIFLDYIQDIPVPDERERYSQVSKAMRLIKRLAVEVQCPIIVGVQAKRTVDDYKDPIPTARDAEWSAVIEQKSDVLIALWRPIRTFHPEDKPRIEVGPRSFVNDDNLMVIALLKQRFERGSGRWAVHFNPATLKITDYDLIHLQ